MKATLTLPIVNNQILLAIKKKKVGAGKWNGFGGKPEPSDMDIYHTAQRELFEETGCGISCHKNDLYPVGIVSFFFHKNETITPDWEVVIFFVKKFTGIATSTSEMENPMWFDFKKIPYENMMPADREFFPFVINEKHFTGIVRFDENQSAIVHSHFQEISQEKLLSLIG